MKAPLVLIILDGWGIAPPGPGNVISLSKLPNMTRYWHSFPHAKLLAAGSSVGLPENEDGNSETGHLNIGAGRIVLQGLTRINNAIADGSFYLNSAFLKVIENAKRNKSNLHLIGLVSDAGVHASLNHLFALIELVKRTEPNLLVFLHLITDGRDSPPKSASIFIIQIINFLKNYPNVHIASVMGRYYAMDRDNRLDRTTKAFEALAEINSRQASDALTAIKSAYNRSETDEFISPTVITDNNEPLARIKKNDSVIFYNFRIDRTRQLTKMLINNIPGLCFVTMTEYEKNLPCLMAFPFQPLKDTLGEILAKQNKTQLRLSESEKERFVTYYFNGMKEESFHGEERIIIPSLKVATYDLAPTMSAYQITAKFMEKFQTNKYDFILINFANADMVGHTGNIHAAITASETIDECLGKIIPLVLQNNGTCIITADHGNAEQMLFKNGSMDTEHSKNPVPFIIINHNLEGKSVEMTAGNLADIAPTILRVADIAIPQLMTGKSYINGSMMELIR